MKHVFAYKVLKEAEYALLDGQGEFSGSTVDIADGYIHLSLAGQLQETLDKHYKDGHDLKLVEVELAACEDGLKFERSRGGADFPHLYGILYKNAARRIWGLTADANGRYKLPDNLSANLET